LAAASGTHPAGRSTASACTHRPWTQASVAPQRPFSFYHDGEPCPRGCGGRTPETWALDLTARYDFRLAGAELHVRLDVVNLLDNDAVTKVDEVAEVETFAPNPDYLEPRFFQSPRRSVGSGWASSRGGA
jgi:hypothetical protein